MFCYTVLSFSSSSLKKKYIYIYLSGAEIGGKEGEERDQYTASNRKERHHFNLKFAPFCDRWLIESQWFLFRVTGV